MRRPDFVIFAALAACSSTPPAETGKPGESPEATAPPSEAEKSDVGRLFPFPNGHIYTYRVSNDAGETRDLTVRTARLGPGRGELRPTASKPRAFEISAEGVKLAAPGTGWVLKAPLTVGASFQGEHGGQTSVTMVGHAHTVPAGAFTGCVTTLEKRGGDRPLAFESVYCPDVGLVSLEAIAGAQSERAELVSHGPAVDLGPDGVKAIKVDPGK